MLRERARELRERSEAVRATIALTLSPQTGEQPESGSLPIQPGASLESDTAADGQAQQT